MSDVHTIYQRWRASEHGPQIAMLAQRAAGVSPESLEDVMETMFMIGFRHGADEARKILFPEGRRVPDVPGVKP
jgi:hypothetical protein